MRLREPAISNVVNIARIPLNLLHLVAKVTCAAYDEQA